MSERAALLISLVVISIVSVAAFLIAVWQGVAKNTLLFEGAKVLPQVGLVSVAGAVISYMVFRYQQASQRADRDRLEELRRTDARVELLRGVLSTVTSAYADLKRGRRLVRAQGLRPSTEGTVIQVQAYDSWMVEVNLVQLKFEQLVQDVASTQEAFGDPEGCIRALKTIEQALHVIIAEFEDERPMLAEAESVSLSRLRRLKAILARQSDDPQGFADGFFPITSNLWELRRAIRADLSRLVGITHGNIVKVRVLDPTTEWRYQ